MKVLVTMIMALLNSTAGAAPVPLRPADFALGIPIEHAAGLPYFVVELPDVVYRTAVDPSLADLRFFDADGRALRHSVVAPAVTEGPAQAPPATIALPLFALSRERATDAVEAQIRIAADGRLVTLTETRALRASETYAWLIDASAVHNTAVRFLVEAEPGADVFVGYTVDGSHDLHNWSVVVGSGTLVRFEQGGQTLRRAGFSIAPGRFPYLRLRWLDPAAAPVLAAVHAELRRPAPPQNLRSLRLAATRVAGQPHEVRFDSAGHFPVSAATLVLEPNRVLGGRLEAGHSTPTVWTPVARSEWYALTVDDNIIRSAPQTLSVRSARHWRFVADTGDALDGGPLPELEIHYVPHQYRVLAEGRPPYLLAIGSGQAAAAAAVSAPGLALPHVADAARLSAPARLGAEFELGGSARRALPKAALPWQRITLWAVLGAGVVLIAAMVWQLRRDLDADGQR